MRCPRCDSDSLKERHRSDVLIDVCEHCRGGWLDRGELEKLITRAQQEVDDYECFYQEFERSYKPPRRQAAEDVHDDEQSRGKREKRKKMGELPWRPLGL